MERRFSLEGKLALLVGSLVLLGVGVAFALTYFIPLTWLALLLTCALMVPISIYTVERFMSPINRVVQALNDGVASLRDSDFSIRIAQDRNDELGDLIGLYNGVGEILRAERQDLFQRELLLDTVIQSTPIALLLCNSRGQVVYSNTAARRLFFSGRKLEGHSLVDVLKDAPLAITAAIEAQQDGLFTVEAEEEQETFHLSCRSFQLNAQLHQLFLVKRLTKELNRREVDTWKKVIRVISHELNNSLAPIASLAHSGNLLAVRSSSDKLQTVFSTIEERAAHLKKFIEGYARFAKLPQPRMESVLWGEFASSLQRAVDFRLSEPKTDAIGYFDPGQMEQVMINLIKNAHEAGSDPGDIWLQIDQDGRGSNMILQDKGSGMSDQVLSSALLPFYSTKQTGTGLGLPLCREIVEAHGGRLNFRNRQEGGLRVEIFLPSGHRSMEIAQ